MMSTILMTLLIATGLFIGVVLKKFFNTTHELTVLQNKIKITCHDFRNSITTLRLIIDNIKSHVKLDQETTEPQQELLRLLDILTDIEQSLSKSIIELNRQVRY